MNQAVFILSFPLLSIFVSKAGYVAEHSAYHHGVSDVVRIEKTPKGFWEAVLQKRFGGGNVNSRDFKSLCISFVLRALWNTGDEVSIGVVIATVWFDGFDVTLTLVG